MKFPVMYKTEGSYGTPIADCPKTVPWKLLGPSEERQALRNHGQTLTRLAERGGLSARELYAVLRNEEFNRAVTVEHAVKYINGRVVLLADGERSADGGEKEN